jgi:uncharacterized OB-fold protein
MKSSTPSFAEPKGNVVGAANFVTDGERAALRLSRCRDCGATWFPARSQCSRCASTEVVDDLSATTGEVYASTVVRIGLAQFEPPYVLAYVDVDGARVLAHVEGEEALAPGTPVELKLGRIGADAEGSLHSYIVVPTRGEDAS